MLDINEFIASDKLFDGHYRLLRPLSTDGGTADVWLAIDTNTIDKNADETDESSGMLVAIKIYRPKNALDIEGEQRFREEFKMAFNCHHTNLLQPTSFNIYDEVPYLVLPYCEAGSSEQFIGKKLTNEKIWKFILDVTSGLDRLHSNQPQIIHQDIKPANILIDDNENFTITDFGISTKKTGGQESYYYEDNSGTMAYMAPERFQNDTAPIPQSDIWSSGATLCEILTGNVPFGEEGGINQLKEGASLPKLSGMSSELKNLIRSCLQKDPQKRPTARQIMDMAQKNHHQKRPLIISLVSLSVLILVGIIYYFNRPTPPAPSSSLLNYAQAEELLSQNTTAQEGLKMLQSLIEQNDYQSTFLMSRLYFDASDNRDTLFYDRKWNIMRVYCGIRTDNQQAHNLLMQAFKLNDKDYVSLFQLGSDFFSGERRGCKRNLEYARWCFEQAQKALQHETGALADRYWESIDKVLQRTEGVSAIKP